MSFIKKLFALPTPSQLGKSPRDTLPLKQPNKKISSIEKNVFSWEDYDKEIKQKYPVKYFIHNVALVFIHRNIFFHIRNAYTYISCHIFTNRRHHYLDLRQPKTESCDDYKYGYLDSDTKMLFALFNILELFVKNELPILYLPTEEECSAKQDFGQSNAQQRHLHLEIQALHTWWTSERKLDDMNRQRLLNTWHDLLSDKSHSEKQIKKAWSDLNAADKAFQIKEDKMIARLLKIRKGMWT